MSIGHEDDLSEYTSFIPVPVQEEKGLRVLQFYVKKQLQAYPKRTFGDKMKVNETQEELISR